MSDDEVKKEIKDDHINIKVKDMDNNEVHFKVRRTTKFQKIFDAYCQRKALQPNSVRFILDGERLQPNSTPEEADLEDGDCIDAMMEQVGGH